MKFTAQNIQKKISTIEYPSNMVEKRYNTNQLQFDIYKFISSKETPNSAKDIIWLKIPKADEEIF